MLDWALRIILGAGGLGAILGYVRDRKKVKAEGTVAEQTVELKVDADRLANLEQRLDYTQKAFDAERASMQNQIRSLSTENENLRAELDRKDKKIDDLEARLERVQAEIHSLTGELASLRRPAE